MALYVEIKKKIGDFCLDVKLEAEHEFFAVLGESGCGKSMTLKCIAGIEAPDEGKIILNGRVLFDSQKGIFVPPQKRKIGYLFQNYALFPNMTVEQNIGIAIPKKNRKEETARFLNAFYLEDLKSHYPHMLSGGQRQRTALARMLAAKPEVVLLDEPFSAADSFLRWKLQQEMLNLLEPYEKTVLFVTHNKEEAYQLCKRGTVISHGKSGEERQLKELFSHPKSRAEAMLIGCENLAPVTYEGETAMVSEWKLKWECGQETEWLQRPCYIGIRSEDIQITPLLSEQCSNAMEDKQERQDSQSPRIVSLQGRIERALETSDHMICVIRIETEAGVCAKETLRAKIRTEAFEENAFCIGALIKVQIKLQKMWKLM